MRRMAPGRVPFTKALALFVQRTNEPCMTRPKKRRSPNPTSPELQASERMRLGLIDLGGAL